MGHRSTDKQQAKFSDTMQLAKIQQSMKGPPEAYRWRRDNWESARKLPDRFKQKEPTHECNLQKD